MTKTPPHGTPKNTRPEPRRDDEGGSTDTPQQSAAGAEVPPRSHEDVYRLLAETVQDYAIFALDPAGRVLTWSAGAARIKGFARTEIIGQHFSIFYPEE